MAAGYPFRRRRVAQTGITYIELMLASAIGMLLIAGLLGVAHTAAETGDALRRSNELARDARFAMQRMVRSVARSRRILVPLRDDPGSLLLEHIREQTFPASAPPAGSSLATAVLAVTLPADIDLDGNGVPDADNDGDGLLDEDLPADTSNDDSPGLHQIDDDGNGIIDYWASPLADDDESNDLVESEDAIDGVDDDADGNFDEDPGADNNGDGCPGICGVDDDGDSLVDEGTGNDDDEDGSVDEDWYDPLVFYLDNDVLRQRHPVPWDESGAGGITGRDYLVSDLAENVSRFRVERVAGGTPFELIDLTVELTDPVSGETISLQTRVRLGGAL